MGRLPCAATDVATTVDSPTTTHARQAGANEELRTET